MTKILRIHIGTKLEMKPFILRDISRIEKGIKPPSVLKQ